ncbi:30S ribosomal protein S6, partial [candidate division MSBL1 archaeon SCGC-AAA261O19]
MVRVVVSDPESGKAYQIEPDESSVGRLMGLQIGQSFEGDIVGLSGYQLLVTGGTDKDGFPMRSDVRGPGRKRIVLSKGPGYKPREEGMRRRKLLRGRTVSQDIAQLNVKVTERGEKDIQEILGPKPTS